VSRTPPPPGVVAAAEQDLHDMRERLDLLVQTVRQCLTDGYTPTEASVEVYLTLRHGDRRMAAVMGATAIMRVATADEPVAPGSSARRAPAPPTRDRPTILDRP
jgi:hypothetical protein